MRNDGDTDSARQMVMIVRMRSGILKLIMVDGRPFKWVKVH